jgi:hypothetical protein
MSKDVIQEALGKLNPTDNDHWTQDGLPRIGKVEELSGLKGLKRADVTAANPKFTRQAVLDATPDEPEETPAETPTEPVEPTEGDATDETPADPDAPAEPDTEAPADPEPDEDQKDADLKEASDQQMLLGSSVQPAILVDKDGAEVQLGTIVQEAHERSGLTVEEWNKLAVDKPDEQEALLQAVVDEMGLTDPDAEPVIQKKPAPAKTHAQELEDLELAELNEAEELLVKQLLVIDKEIAELNGDKIGITKEIDKIIAARDSRVVARTNQEAIMDYIATQNQLREQRAARSAALMKGFDPKMVNPKSPLDQAFERRKGRGTQRPTRGVKA